VEKARSPQSPGKTRWQVKLLALLVPLALLAIVDGGLRALTLIPPDDPVLFHVRTHAADFSPFVESGDGSVSIKPDWVNPGNGLRRRLGRRAGQQFIYPGFRSSVLAKQKPENAIRVFVLGGSTTFGLYVESREAFPARIEQALQEAVGDRVVDVVNLGCAGWASPRVANLLDAVLELDPDLVIVYSGHNEMLEGHLDTLSALDLPNRLRARLLSISSLFAWMNHALGSWMGPRGPDADAVAEKVTALRAGEIPTYEPRAVPDAERTLPEEGFFRAAAAGYAASIRSMQSAADAAGVPLLFILPIPNLLAPPSLSAHGAGFERERELRGAMDAAREALRDGRLEPGLRQLDRAVELSPRHAMVHYWRAAALRSAGRLSEARQEYQRALDLDVRTHRITSWLEATMIESVEAAGGRWIDLRPAFRRQLSAERATALFVDHLHPTPLGHRRIAEVAMPAVVELLEIEASAGSADGDEDAGSGG
jgi:lysophospholipase L1-like esterase